MVSHSPEPRLAIAVNCPRTLKFMGVLDRDLGSHVHGVRLPFSCPSHCYVGLKGELSYTQVKGTLL